MEEILASIRRIIADDQAFIQSGAPSPMPPSPLTAPAPSASGYAPPPAPPSYQVREPRPRTEPLPPSFAPPSFASPSGGYAPASREVPERTPAYTTPPYTSSGREDYLAQARQMPAASAPAMPQPAPRQPVPPPTAATPQHYPIDGQFQSYKTAVYPQLPDLPPLEESRDLPPPPMAAAEPFVPRPELRQAESRPADHPLVSPQTDAAVSSAFGALIASQALPSDEEMGRMVREMLRPMLKAWLDDNLPVLVERLVRTEIERVARGR